MIKNASIDEKFLKKQNRDFFIDMELKQQRNPEAKPFFDSCKENI